VAKAVLEAAIAARDAGLDRGDLALHRARYVPPRVDGGLATAVSSGTVAGDTTDRAGEPVPRYALVDSSPGPPPVPPARFAVGRAMRDSAVAGEAVTVPDVRRLPLRVAVRELHRAGLRAAVASDVPFELSPAPGAVVPRGTLVRIARR
jgi:hypothetical protein